MSVTERIKRAEEKTNPTPTERQKQAGNYKKGKVNIKGFRIAIENPVGSIREGKDEKGNAWKNKMKNAYGYFVGTLGKDGDPIDVYLGNDFQSGVIYIIDQIDPDTHNFDEHKVMFGFSSEEEAKKAYLSNFNRDWKGLDAITGLKIETFRNWLYDKRMTEKPAKKFRSKIQVRNQKEDKICRILLKGEVIEDETLKDLQSQIKTDFDTLVIEIRSPGGSVLEGMRIMQWLDELSQNNKYIVSVVSANAYSIASMIMLAANKRYISRHGEIMVHDPMIPKLEYANANELEYQVGELRRLEKILRELYIIFTGLSEDTIQKLMGEESYIKPEDAVKYGFADEVIDLEKKPFEMADVNNVKDKIKNMRKTTNLLNRVISFVDNRDIVNQLYGTMAGEEIEIFQKDPAQYSEGDRTDVKEGEFQLADGSKIIVEDNVIKEIVKGEEVPQEVPEQKPENIDEEQGEVPGEQDTGPDEYADKKEPEMKEDKEKEMADYKDGEFNTGPAPKKEEMAEHGEKEMVDGEGKEQMEEIVKEEEALDQVPETPAPAPTVAPEQVPETEAPAMEKVKEMVGTIEEMRKTIDTLQKKVSELTTEKLQKDISEMTEKMVAVEKKVGEFEKFEDLASQAIDKLATNTSSVFKPEAKAKPQAEPRGSIFQQLKEKRGLK